MRISYYFAAFLAVAAAPARADAGDPPSRVARLSYQSGQVSFRPGSIEEWTAATLNYPLTSGDHLWTDRGAQTEMHVGSTAIRMNSETALAFLNLDDRTVQLSLTEGAIHVRIRYLDEGESFEVDTPNVAISLLRPGEYRIDADGDNGITTVTVRSGEAELTGGGSAFPVRSTESARISGTDRVSQELNGAPPPNDFERWCEARDRREEQSQSARYVSRETIGYEDLDEYGAWRDMPEYGWVWAPARVSAGWAPYRYGHWAWVEPWGWTWIDDAPWGFAPFHYGRWAFVGDGWVWVPGRIVARPVYAPALVVFVGGPRGLSVGAGHVAWFPLGPREVYRPVYRVSETYVRQVNVTQVNVTNINVTNVYVNRNVEGAVTAVPHDTFVSARAIGRGGEVIPAREAAQAQVMGSTAPIAPRRESVLGRPGEPGFAPPTRAIDRPVVARIAPPPAPVSFRAKQQALEASQGRPLDDATLNNLRGNDRTRNPMVRTAPPAERGPRRGGWSRPSPASEQNSRPEPQAPITREAPRSERPARIQPPMVQQPPAAPVQRSAEPARNEGRQPIAAPVERNAEPRTERPSRSGQPPAAARPSQETRREAGQQRRTERGEKKTEKKEEK